MARERCFLPDLRLLDLVNYEITKGKMPQRGTMLRHCETPEYTVAPHGRAEDGNVLLTTVLWLAPSKQRLFGVQSAADTVVANRGADRPMHLKLNCIGEHIPATQAGRNISLRRRIYLSDCLLEAVTYERFLCASPGANAHRLVVLDTRGKVPQDGCLELQLTRSDFRRWDLTLPAAPHSWQHSGTCLRTLVCLPHHDRFTL
jgi:hypothetical protein